MVSELIKKFLISIAVLIPLTVGAVEYKLFVGSLNKQATEKEVEEVSQCYFLSPYEIGYS